MIHPWTMGHNGDATTAGERLRFDHTTGNLLNEVQGTVREAVETGVLDQVAGERAFVAFACRLPDGDAPTTFGPYFTTAGLCRRRGVTRQALHGRVRRNALLAVKPIEAQRGTQRGSSPLTWPFFPALLRCSTSCTDPPTTGC